MIGKTLRFVFQLTEGQKFLEFTLVYGNYFTFLFFIQHNLNSLPVTEVCHGVGI